MSLITEQHAVRREILGWDNEAKRFLPFGTVPTRAHAHTNERAHREGRRTHRHRTARSLGAAR
jgi:hypothetical protein